MMYSIKMRCSKGGPHEEGGKHISGAERILHEDEVEQELINVYRRAITHERGKPDFINFKIEEIDEKCFSPYPCPFFNYCQGSGYPDNALQLSTIYIDKHNKSSKMIMYSSDRYLKIEIIVLLVFPILQIYLIFLPY